MNRAIVLACVLVLAPTQACARQNSEQSPAPAVPRAVSIMRPGLIRIEPFGITSEFRENADRSQWLVYVNDNGEFTCEDWIERAWRTAQSVGADLTVFRGTWFKEVESEGRWRDDTNLMPTEDELRAQLWLSIIGGARAFELFAFNSTDDARIDAPSGGRRRA